MEITDSLTQFFYNIVPGFLFLLALYFLKYGPTVESISALNKSITDGLILLFIFFALSLFIGFVFQGLTKLERKYLCLDQKTWKRVEKDNENLYPKAEKFLIKRGLISNKQKQELKTFFYLIHSYLLASNKAQQANFFAARIAFWANIFFGTFILIFLTISRIITHEYLCWLIGLLIFSRWLYVEYLKNMYDTVLKTFISIIEIDKYMKENAGKIIKNLKKNAKR